MAQTHEERLEWTRQWRARNRERIRTYNDQYMASHPAVLEKKRAANRDYHWEHRDDALRRNREYQERHGPRTPEESRIIRYGLDDTARTEMLAAQNGKCAICGTVLDISDNRRTHTDHIHGTKIVRGILCHTCNKGLGYFKEDPKLIESAIRYLKEHSNGTGSK